MCAQVHIDALTIESAKALERGDAAQRVAELVEVLVDLEHLERRVHERIVADHAVLGGKSEINQIM